MTPSVKGPTGPGTDLGASAGHTRDRDVLLLMIAVVVVVIGAGVASALIPGSDTMLARAPVVVALLIAGTGIVLVGVLRGRRRG